ncbi:hypothetical protein CRYUN_Cryun17cG0079500 [Craigia yunnanensis]
MLLPVTTSSADITTPHVPASQPTSSCQFPPALPMFNVPCKDPSPMLRNGEIRDWIGTFKGHKGAVWSVCLDTNALRAASIFVDFTTKVWDALIGDGLHSFEHKHIDRACAFFRGYAHSDAPLREVDKSPSLVRTVAWMHSDKTILISCTDIGGVKL